MNWRCSEHIVSRVLSSGDLFVVDRRSGDSLVLNGTARHFIELVNDARGLEEVADAFCDAYGVDRARASADVAALAQQLEEFGILERTSSDCSAPPPTRLEAGDVPGT